MRPNSDWDEVNYVFIHFQRSGAKVRNLVVSSLNENQDRVFSKVEDMVPHLEDLKTNCDLGKFSNIFFQTKYCLIYMILVYFYYIRTYLCSKYFCFQLLYLLI